MQPNDKYVHVFLQKVCKQIRFKSMHKHISRELADHIEDQKNEYIKEGFDEEQAVIKAIEQMGDPVMIGKQLNKTHKPRTEWTILFIITILIGLGGVFQYLSTGVNTTDVNMFLHFLLYMPIGLSVFLLVYFLDYRWIGRHAILIYFVLLTIVIIGFLAFDRGIGGYTHVYYLTLLFLPIFAGIIHTFKGRKYVGLIYSGLFYAVMAFLCVQASSFSALLLLTVSCLVILTVSIIKGLFEIKRKYSFFLVYASTLLVGTAVCLTTMMMAPHRFTRISMIFSPAHDPLGAGYHLTIIRKLIFAAQPFGSVSLADDKGIIGMLPMWSTDLSLTYIIAKFGYIPGMMIVSIMLIFIARIFVVVLKQENAFGFLVSFSVCIAITGQIIFYVLCNLGVITPISVTFPLFSFGAFGFVTNMALIGLLLSVYRRTNLVYDSLQQQ